MLYGHDITWNEMTAIRKSTILPGLLTLWTVCEREALKMETVCFSETLSSTDESTPRQNPEEQSAWSLSKVSTRDEMPGVWTWNAHDDDDNSLIYYNRWECNWHYIISDPSSRIIKGLQGYNRLSAQDVALKAKLAANWYAGGIRTLCPGLKG
jgi:hypothetical protein